MSIYLCLRVHDSLSCFGKVSPKTHEAAVCEMPREVAMSIEIRVNCA